jgi:SHS2 domain-containing protein
METQLGDRVRPWHEVLDHAPDLEIWVHATTWPELVAEAGRALAEQLVRGAQVAAAGPWRRVAVRAADRPSLLAAWLNELLFHAEAEWWIPVEISDVRASDTEIDARVHGAIAAGAPVALKAADAADVHVRDTAGLLEARLALRRSDG